jgi:hypothetical protein
MRGFLLVVLSTTSNKFVTDLIKPPFHETQPHIPSIDMDPAGTKDMAHSIGSAEVPNSHRHNGRELRPGHAAMYCGVTPCNIARLSSLLKPRRPSPNNNTLIKLRTPILHSCPWLVVGYLDIEPHCYNIT